MKKRDVEDITLDMFLGFSDEDFEGYSRGELDYLFDKFVRSSEGFVSVSVGELLERFGYGTDGFRSGVLGLSFSGDFVSSFVRRGKIVFSDGVDGGVELVLDSGSRDRCVVFRGDGEWVYSDFGLLLSMS